MTSPKLKCPDLTSAELNGPELTSSELPSPDLPFRHYVGTIKISIYTLQIPSRYPLAIIQTPSVHHPDTLPTPSKDTSDNIQTPFRHPPNFKHVGSFLVVEARCGFLLVLLVLLPWENKVNSHSNQLKLSWV